MSLLRVAIVQMADAAETGRKLGALRKQIDVLDRLLFGTVAQRDEVSKEIAAVKADSDEPIPIVQPDRRAAVIVGGIAIAGQRGIDPVFAREFMELLVGHSEEVQGLPKKQEVIVTPQQAVDNLSPHDIFLVY